MFAHVNTHIKMYIYFYKNGVPLLSKLLFLLNTAQPQRGRHGAMFVICSPRPCGLKTAPVVSEIRHALEGPKERIGVSGLVSRWFPGPLATGTLRGCRWKVRNTNAKTATSLLPRPAAPHTGQPGYLSSYGCPFSHQRSQLNLLYAFSTPGCHGAKPSQAVAW